MKATHFLGSIALLFVVTTYGQGVFQYDQQSSANETPFPGSGYVIQQIAPPFGQSFTPSLSAISFIRLKFSDANLSDSLGATLYVNIRSGSISGTILGATATVTMVNGFAGVADFFFTVALALTPGTTYYFEPVLQSGGPWNIDAGELFYPGGALYANGQPNPAGDCWFREGIIVPEPSTWALLLAGGVILSFARRFNFASRSGAQGSGH